MTFRNPKVDQFLEEGCGRCEYYQTPDCKVHLWTEELIELRRIALNSGLKEEIKWSNPCYTIGGKNVLMVSALKGAAIMSFFKGALLKDPKKMLVSPGKNSHSDRQFRFTNAEDIRENEEIISSYIFEAIRNEKDGKKVEPLKTAIPLPQELIDIFIEQPDVKEAFEALSPGRRRSYQLHISGAKQPATRRRRAERCIPKIYLGKGFNER